MSQREINEIKAIVAKKLASGEIRQTYCLPTRKPKGVRRERDVLRGQPAVKVI